MDLLDLNTRRCLAFSPLSGRIWSRCGATEWQCLAFILLPLLFLALPATVQADPDAEFARLLDHYNQLIAERKYSEAETTAATLLQRANGPLKAEPGYLLAALHSQAQIYVLQKKHDLADKLYEQLVKEMRRTGVAKATIDQIHLKLLENRVYLQLAAGLFAEAETTAEQHRQLAKEKDERQIIKAKELQAIVFEHQMGYEAARARYQEVFEEKKKIYGKEHFEVAITAFRLGYVCSRLGQYKRAIEYCWQAEQQKHDLQARARCRYLLATIYREQGQHDRAKEYLKQCLEDFDNRYDKARTLDQMAVLYCRQHLYDEADKTFQEAWETLDRAEGVRNRGLEFVICYGWAHAYLGRKDYAAAEEKLRQALAICTEFHGNKHLDVACCHHALGYVYTEWGDHEKAEPWLTSAITIFEEVGASPALLCQSYLLRARGRRNTGRSAEAEADMQEAIVLAERQRAHFSGGPIERAKAFVEYIAEVFEQAVDLWTEQGKVAKVLEAIERSRSRSLLDQMESMGVDFLDAMPEDRRQSLEDRRAKTLTRIAELEARRNAGDRSAKTQEELKGARKEFLDLYAEICNASPAYQGDPVALQRLQEWVSQQDALLLEYFFGEDGGYVLVVPAGGQPRLEKLHVNNGQCDRWGIEPGALTAKKLQSMLTNDQQMGLLQCLSANPINARESGGGDHDAGCALGSTDPRAGTFKYRERAIPPAGRPAGQQPGTGAV